MLKHRELTRQRINQLGRRITRHIYADPMPLNASYLPSPEPLPFAAVKGRRFKKIEPGTIWGDAFDCAWFRFEGKLDSRYKGQTLVALIDIGGEGCVLNKRGKPLQGLTSKFEDQHGGFIGPKREVRLFSPAKGSESVSLLVDGGANHLQGQQRRCEFRQAELCTFDEPMFKLYHEFRFLELLMLELPVSSRHGQLIERCLNDVCNIMTRWDPTEVIAARRRLAAELARPANASALNVTAIGHAHMDVAWLWPLRETVRKVGRTFSTALRMMEEYPDYHFGASQPHLYQMLKDNYPSLFNEVRAAVKGGRWEVQGGMWVESDCNIPSGESLVRQVLHGKRFFHKEFGVDVKHLWLPDVFGYSAALPQILRKSGIDYFTTHKLNWNQFNRFPHHTMYWQGIDGSRIFSHFMAGNDYNVPATPKAFMNFERENRDGDRTDHALCLFGIGDGGGGPGRTHIEWTTLARDLEDLPKVTMGKAADFFTAAESSSRDLLTWVGELYFEYHRGTYTSQALVKKMNRRLELLIREVEFLYCQMPASRYPARELERIWKVILLNQFHDIIPGSSINRVYKEAHAQYAAAETELIALRDTADKSYGDSVNTRDTQSPRIVFNPLSWARQTIAFMPDERRTRWVDAAGNRLISQRVREGMLVQLQVPSMGHNLFGFAQQSNVAPASALPSTNKKLENNLLRVDFAADGRIRRIYDKSLRREVLAPGAKANEFCLYEDLPLAYEAWDIDAYYLEKAPTHPHLTSVELVEHGALRATIRQTWEDDNYTITQHISLDRDSRIIEFDTQVDWQESQHMLRVAFPVNVKAEQANYEIQFGHVARPTHANTSWDMARFEVVGHKWADLSQPNYGVAILNDCKYGHRIFGNTISLNLLRSPTRPDPEADRHIHRFRYALYPHAGNLVEAQVVNRAWEFNVPVRLLKAAGGKGKRPAMDSLITSSCSNVIIDTVKRAEDDRQIIVRMYESAGIDCVTDVHINGTWDNIEEVNLLEEPLRQIAGARQNTKLTFSPFEIKTIKLNSG